MRGFFLILIFVLSNNLFSQKYLELIDGGYTIGKIKNIKIKAIKAKPIVKYSTPNFDFYFDK